MRVLGIDPGTLVTGYGIVESARGGSLKCVASGIIKGKSEEALSRRLLRISDTLIAVIREYRPECAAIESAFVAKNIRSALYIGHARGAAMVCAAGAGLDVSEYAPKAVKQAVTGYGGAAKEQMQYMVKAILNLGEVPYADAADALAVAICHINCGKITALDRAINANKKRVAGTRNL